MPKGGLGQFADLKGGLMKKKRVVFLKGVIPQCTLWVRWGMGDLKKWGGWGTLRNGRMIFKWGG